MINKARVYLREENAYREVAITGADKPRLDQESLARWQRFMNLLARVLQVPAALIMEISQNELSVLINSQNMDDPYQQGDHERIGCGLYCETVIGSMKELRIENAQQRKAWADNPDVKLDMIAYYGLPLLWPDKELFGTICVLDNKPNSFQQLYRDVLFEMKLAFERELTHLIEQRELKYYAETDVLTSIANRRKMQETIAREFERAKRYSDTFTITLIDMDNFKKINDLYGHDAGDMILKSFATNASDVLRKIDYIGRWGGDEFIIVCPQTSISSVLPLIARIRQTIVLRADEPEPHADFSYGIAQYEPNEVSYETIIKRADHALYQCKLAHKPSYTVHE